MSGPANVQSTDSRSHALSFVSPQRYWSGERGVDLVIFLRSISCRNATSRDKTLEYQARKQVMQRAKQYKTTNETTIVLTNRDEKRKVGSQSKKLCLKILIYGSKFIKESSSLVVLPKSQIPFSTIQKANIVQGFSHANFAFKAY